VVKENRRKSRFSVISLMRSSSCDNDDQVNRQRQRIWATANGLIAGCRQCKRCVNAMVLEVCPGRRREALEMPDSGIQVDYVPESRKFLHKVETVATRQHNGKRYNFIFTLI